MKTNRITRNGSSGFTILEVAIAAIILILIVAASASALRLGLRVLDGSEVSSISSQALRQFREYTFKDTVAELDARDGQTFAPVSSDGQPLPGADGFTIQVSVVPVSDLDLDTVVGPGDSLTRKVTASVWYDGAKTLEAVWIATDA